MKNFSILIFIFVILFVSNTYAAENKFLSDKNIDILYLEATDTLANYNIDIKKKPLGIVISFDIMSININKNNFDLKTCEKLCAIKCFLAKIKNPVIIEVYLNKVVSKKQKANNWEMATKIANMLEDELTQPKGNIEQNRVRSIGYVKYSLKNTSNNGCKYVCCVDIIILCNIFGE